MAAIALEKLQSQLNCSICLETYTNPKQLHCHHVYCQQCLVKLAIQDRQGRLSLTCPGCRKVTPVPANGVGGLQAAFRVNQLLEIVEEHKKAVVASPKTVSPSATRDSTIVCHEHGEKEVELYCETCATNICYKCAIKGGKHQSHDYIPLNEAFERYKEEILISLKPMEDQLQIIEKSLKHFGTRRDEIIAQQASIKSDIHKTVNHFREKLELRRKELLSQVDELTKAKFKSLAEQKDQIETIQAQLSNCLLFMRENLKTDNLRKALMMKSTSVRQMNKLTTTFKPSMVELREQADMIFLKMKDLTAECEKYGKVYAAGSLDYSKSQVTGKVVNAKVLSVGEECTALLETLNSDGLPWKLSTTSILCELVSDVMGTSSTCSVKERRPGLYKISYQPTIKGKHLLHVKVEGQHVRGSPFIIDVRLAVEEIGHFPIQTYFGVKHPHSVAISPNREIVVSEWENHRVTVLSPGGVKLFSFGTEGSGEGQFKAPQGVTVDNDGNIYVADGGEGGNSRIQKFTSRGLFLKAARTSSIFKHSDPLDIVFNPTNRKLYVVIRDHHSVQILDTNLSYIGTFGRKGSRKGQLFDPLCIACDSVGNLYLTDQHNARVQVFTPDGKFLRLFPKSGAWGEMKWLWGVAVDPSDRVYVVEWANKCVFVFTSDGQFVRSFSRWDEMHPNDFEAYHGLAIDSSGVVYVCGFHRDCLTLF